MLRRGERSSLNRAGSEVRQRLAPEMGVVIEIDRNRIMVWYERHHNTARIPAKFSHCLGDVSSLSGAARSLALAKMV